VICDHQEEVIYNSYALNFNFKWSCLDPSTWLNVAILVAPLRLFVLGSVGSFNVSFFRICLLLVWGTYLLNMFWVKKIRLLKGGRNVAILTVLMFVMTLMSVLYSPNLILGDSLTRFLVKSLGWLWVITIIFVVQRKDAIKMHVRYFVLSSFVPMIFGWCQTISYYFFGNALTIFSHLAVKNAELSGVQYSSYFRPSGTFLEPNYYGMFLSMVTVIILANIFFANQRILSRYLSYLILASAIVQLITTTSLSAFIGFGFGCAIILLLYLKNITIRSSVMIPIVVMLFLSFLSLRSPFLYNNIFAGIKLKLIMRSKQTVDMFGRKKYFEALPQVLEDSLGIGVGYGGLSKYVDDPISTMHSAYLTVLGEQGFLSFSLLLLLTVSICRRLVKRSKQMGVIAIGLVAAFISLVMGNLGYDAMFSFDASWTLIGLAAATASLPIRIGGNNDKQYCSYNTQL